MKTTLKPNKRFSLRAGFSLVELLVVIAVIGVIAAIAIPNIGSITGSAQSASYQRNAQNIASVASSAKAAGWSPAGDKATDLAAIIAPGGVNGAGTFSSTVFSAPMGDDDANSASVYLTDDLEYVSGGQQTATSL